MKGQVREIIIIVTGYTDREKHVLLVLVDSSEVRNRVSVLDHTDRLA